jgi:hypothetical protein
VKRNRKELFHKVMKMERKRQRFIVMMAEQERQIARQREFQARQRTAIQMDRI